ncbi:MAG: hypothetical protein DRP22_00480 [Verrucomicrobia bacterium]|nr:MAG: hypothetical protein DRP22_00480 [Verrucomicrobiota bacterium]
MKPALEDISLQELEVEGCRLHALRFILQGVPCLLVAGESAFVGCGAFDIHTFGRLGVPAAKVMGVSTIEDLLEATIAESNDLARKRGVVEGMSVKAAARLL